jgi:hypothetical protein
MFVLGIPVLIPVDTDVNTGIRVSYIKNTEIPVFKF